MMTLAALAANGATVRPSGETVEQQELRILAGINTQLANAEIATSNSWQALWVGLTQDRANLVYVAQNTTAPASAPEYAVCLRGTVAGSAIDTAEDMHVGLMLPFAAGGTPPGTLGNISQGAMEAFTEIVMGTNLVAVLNGLVNLQRPNNPTFYVTGHSLGGAMATTVSLYLATGVTDHTMILPYTFAAPTAGDQNFAAWFNQQFSWAECYFNQYDLVPNAWWNLIGSGPSNPPTPEAVEYFYPGMGGGVALRKEIQGMIQNIYSNANPQNYGYVQPKQQAPLNSDFTVQSPAASSISTIQDWEAEAAYQHLNNTYLSLLQGTPLPDVVPVVSSISPAQGLPTGFTTVTITGTNFTPDSVVDFGVRPGIVVSVAGNGESITALSPAGIGIVDVVVTNKLGTSAVVKSDQFTYAAPA